MSNPVSYLIDESVYGSLVKAMEHAELTFVESQHVLGKGTDDRVILTYAAENGLVVITRDINTMVGFYWEYVIEIGEHPGLVVILDKYVRQIGSTVEWLGTRDAGRLRNQTAFYPDD